MPEILEPCNFLSKVYGFDTFGGFPSVAAEDKNSKNAAISKMDHLKPEYEVYSELQKSIATFDETRLLKHQYKVVLVKGDAMQTIPAFLNENQHVLVSILLLISICMSLHCWH